MATNNAKDTAAAGAEAPTLPAAPSNGADEYTIDDFCRRLSLTEKRYTLIGGFNAEEKRLGRNKDSYDAYYARFVLFINRPA